MTNVFKTPCYLQTYDKKSTLNLESIAHIHENQRFFVKEVSDKFCDYILYIVWQKFIQFTKMFQKISEKTPKFHDLQLGQKRPDNKQKHFL